MSMLKITILNYLATFEKQRVIEVHKSSTQISRHCHH